MSGVAIRCALVDSIVVRVFLFHHVKEEQNEMFLKVKASTLDTVELGARMAARKDELLAEVA